MSFEIVEAVITADDADWLDRFVRSLVEDRLVACGNVSGPIRSIYQWKGVVEEQTEYRATLHTRAALIPAIVERTNREHSYETPCVIAAPLITGNPDYFAWVIAETEQPTGTTNR
jgi:periplasmic divalent cation tolerance protein